MLYFSDLWFMCMYVYTYIFFPLGTYPTRSLSQSKATGRKRCYIIISTEYNDFNSPVTASLFSPNCMFML